MNTTTDVQKLKYKQLTQVAAHREELRSRPRLNWLFFELTNRCNLFCQHCGSRCNSSGINLPITDIEDTLMHIRADGHEDPMIALTGGEPMLHPDFKDIALRIHEMGFRWGMTTNATLIDRNMAKQLRISGMGSVSVSIDGLEQTHDQFRGQKGAWQRAINGIRTLQDAGFDPQVTTVFHRNNIHEMEAMYSFLKDEGIRHWRPINIEPIGRACESHGLLLESEQFRKLIEFIQNKRFSRDNRMEVCYGCSHYLGVKTELMVRDHYFLCGAGILVASIRCNGDITACLDIENRPELIQGNIHRDDFLTVWRNRFQVFRKDRTAECEQCINCPDRFLCGGDSFHTWDFDHHSPLLCNMNLLHEF